jgi:hypothetical protein
MQELHDMQQRDPAAKAIVFSQFVNMLDLLEYRIKRGGIDCVKLSGHMNITARDKVLEVCALLCLHMQCLHYNWCLHEVVLRTCSTAKCFRAVAVLLLFRVYVLVCTVCGCSCHAHSHQRVLACALTLMHYTHMYTHLNHYSHSERIQM